MLIGGFQPFTLSDYPGKPSAIVFTQGCNFRCPFCHNRHLWTETLPHPSQHTPQALLSFMSQRKAKLKGIVVTGGEPTLHTKLSDFLSDIKIMGFNVKLDTNGSHPQVVEDLIISSLVDYIAMDIKAPLEKYSLLCGVPVDTTAITRSVEIIHSSGVPHHFRTTVYRTMLSDKDLKGARFLVPDASEHRMQTFCDSDNKG